MSELITGDCNLIVLGAWNPSIIQPIWLRQQFPELIGKEFLVKYIGGTKSALQFDFGKIIFTSDNEKLIFTPKNIDDDTLRYISELSISIFKKLEHTPINAAGCNFVYKLDKNESFVFEKGTNREALKKYYESVELREPLTSLIKHSFSLTDCQLNINYLFATDTRISYNFHFKLPNSMQSAAEQLKENFDFSMELNKKLIKEA